jgi:hypothetical protein
VCYNFKAGKVELPHHLWVTIPQVKINEVFQMTKSVFAALAAAPLFAGAAIAGPYVNVEANSGFVGSDYGGTVTDFHVGYEGAAGALGYYAQVGPSLVAIDGADTDTVFSGKVGGSVAATDALSIYGEVSFATGANGADNGYGTKAGLKFTF